MATRVPYSQQFTPEQTPIKKLLPILQQYTGKRDKLRAAIAAAFFKDTKDQDKIAGNTLISLSNYGIITEQGSLTAFGNQLIAAYRDEAQAHALIAKRLLVEMEAIAILETLREMNAAGIKPTLENLPGELSQRGIDASRNSSDLSGVLNWLREAGVLSRYEVNDARLSELLGTPAETLQALKNLSTEQIAFARAMVALNVTDWFPYNKVCEHAEAIFSGEISFNMKDVVQRVLRPLEATGLIEIRKRSKQDKDTPEGRGGKATDVKPTGKFDKEIAEPLLSAFYKSAGYSDIRKIRAIPLSQIVADIEQVADSHKRGIGLELLAMRLCQTIALDFMGWRETDEEVAGGGEVDAMFDAARLTYSRWQVQCKVGKIVQEAIAKEKGMQEVTLANVILVVGTKNVTESAQTYRRKIVSKSSLNIILIDGQMLKSIIEDMTHLVVILRQQAEAALKMKPRLENLKGVPPSGAEGNEPQRPAHETQPGKPKHTGQMELSYSTAFGRAYTGDSLAVLPALINQGVRVKLIMTSPPFALVRKKDYGNQDADSYVRWFEKFTPYFREILTPDGSLVIDIGGSWIKGIPAKSTYHFKLLIQLCESGFYLAQDFYHYNPARLPTPAEWVTVRRLRVKDAINHVWWLAADPFVKADNRRVLRPYSDSMKGLLRNGYKAQLRPSGHDISEKFQRDNKGSIPPNLFQFSNTESNSYYLRRCRDEGIKPHPARFPQALPDFFISLLTDPGDIVLDPFAGSNVTGAAAETAGRKWISVELDPLYVKASQFRFEKQRPTGVARKVALEPASANLFAMVA